MVEAIFPFLKQHGAEDGACFSDAFSLSARSMAYQPRVRLPTFSWHRVGKEPFTRKLSHVGIAASRAALE
jgi:hypothetical protein